MPGLKFGVAALSGKACDLSVLSKTRAPQSGFIASGI